MVSKKSAKRRTAKSAKAKSAAKSRKATSRPSVKSTSVKGARAKSVKAKSGSVKSARAGSASAKSLPVRKKPVPVDIKQSCSYKGQDWWEWAVWIEGPDKVLDEIESVEYFLHSTFPDPLRRKTNRTEKFRIESSGWGEFMIKVHILTRKGVQFKTQHWLTLDYPTTSSRSVSSGAIFTKPGHEKPTLFLSAGVSELRFGNELGSALEKLGCEVLKMEDAPPDVPWDKAILLLMKRCDLLVMLIYGGLTSWGIRQISAALDRKLPILPVVIGTQTQLPDQLKQFQAINLKDAYNPEIAPHLAEQIKKSIKH